MSSNRVQVLLLGQQIAVHHSSHLLAAELVKVSVARWEDPITRKKICLLTTETWAQVKERFRGYDWVPKLLPSGDSMNLMLNYPPRNYESDGHRRQAKLWLNATRF